MAVAKKRAKVTRPRRKRAKRKAQTSSAAKVAAHRVRLRKRGLRPVSLWLPDARSPTFTAEAHRQSELVARGSHAEADQAFVDSISEPL